MVPLAFQASSAHAQASGTWNSGEQFYGHVCARCHETGIGPVLRGRALPVEYITTVARQGFKEMPAFRLSDIDDQTLQQVAEFVSHAQAWKEGN
jgi:4-cresol dehydrogenase (hydroxylating) cytochrome subunit